MMRARIKGSGEACQGCEVSIRDGVRLTRWGIWQAMAAEDKQALDAMVEEAVRNNLEDFAAHFVEPGAALWVDLQRAAHDKSKTRRQK